MPSAFRLPIFGIVLLLLVPLFLQAKIWTSSDGRTIEAELLEYKDGVAQLKRTDGRTVAIRKEQLSQADQDYLENLSKVEPDPLPLGATMEVHGISIAKKMPPSEGGRMMWRADQEGTRVTLLIQVPDYSIVGLDDEASRLTRFSDDKNSDLLKTAPTSTGGVLGTLGNLGGMMRNREQAAPPVQIRTIEEAAGEWILIDCSAPNLPASGTQTVALEGAIVLQCGQGIKTTEHKNIPLDGSGKFMVGDISVTIKKENRPQFGGFGPEMKMQISFTSDKPLDGIVSCDFLDAQGNEIDWQNGGWMGLGQTQTRYFNLAEEVDSLTIQLEEYENIETITLPVSLKVGLGL